MGGTPMSFITNFLRGHWHRNEKLFLRMMEHLGIMSKGAANEAFVNFLADPRFSAEHPENKDDDDRIFLNFQPIMGVAANEPSDRMKLFHSKEHKKVYNQMLERGVMNLQIVDFDFLDLINMNFREKLAFLQLENFFSETVVAYPESTAFFYSNLSFLD